MFLYLCILFNKITVEDPDHGCRIALFQDLPVSVLGCYKHELFYSGGGCRRVQAVRH